MNETERILTCYRNGLIAVLVSEIDNYRDVPTDELIKLRLELLRVERDLRKIEKKKLVRDGAA